MYGGESVVHVVLHLTQQLSVCCVWRTTRHFYLQPWPKLKKKSTKIHKQNEHVTHAVR